MARKRMLDPKFWEDTKIKHLSHTERLLFIGCISAADDEGRLIADPALLRSKVFPYDEISADEVKAMRDKIAKIIPAFVLYSDGDGEEYVAFRNWETYQKPSHAKPSSLPEPPFVRHSSFSDEESPSDSSDVRPQDRLGKVSIDKDSNEDKGKSLVKHWAVQCYKHVVHRHIKIPLREAWVEFAERNYPEGDGQFDALKTDIKAFMAKGWYEGNIDWFMKWVIEGKPEKWAGGKYAKSKRGRSAPTIDYDEALKRQAAEAELDA